MTDLAFEEPRTPCNECGQDMDDTEIRILDKNCLHRLRRASTGAALNVEDWTRIVHAEFHGGDFDACLRPEADRATARSLLNRAARLAQQRAMDEANREMEADLWNSDR